MSDPHEPGTPAGTDPADIERRAAIAEVLGKEVWPADRNTLVAKAEEANAPTASSRSCAGCRTGSSSRTCRTSPRRSGSAPSSSGSDMTTQKEPVARGPGQRDRATTSRRGRSCCPRSRRSRAIPTRPRATSTRRSRPRRSSPSRRSGPSTPIPTTPRAGTGSRRTPPTCPDGAPRASGPAAVVRSRFAGARQPRPCAEPDRGRPPGHGRRIGRLADPRPARGRLPAPALLPPGRAALRDQLGHPASAPSRSPCGRSWCRTARWSSAPTSSW